MNYSLHFALVAGQPEECAVTATVLASVKDVPHLCSWDGLPPVVPMLYREVLDVLMTHPSVVFIHDWSQYDRIFGNQKMLSTVQMSRKFLIFQLADLLVKLQKVSDSKRVMLVHYVQQRQAATCMEFVLRETESLNLNGVIRQCLIDDFLLVE